MSGGPGEWSAKAWESGRGSPGVIREVIQGLLGGGMPGICYVFGLTSRVGEIGCIIAIAVITIGVIEQRLHDTDMNY